MEEPQVKRKRRNRATAQQREMLLSFMEKNPDVSQGKFSSTFTKYDRKRKLAELADLLNSLGGATKTSEQWRKCWNDIRGYTRGKIARHNSSMAKTGGGPSKTDDELNDFDIRVSNIVGWTSATGDKEVPEAGFHWINEAAFSENSLPSDTSSTSEEQKFDISFKLEPDQSVDQCDTNTPTQSIRKDEIPTESLEILSKELEALYESKMNTDCVLKVGSEQFPVHRALLCARSSIFADIFHHNTPESCNGVLELSGVDAVVLNNVLYYIYTGKTRGLTPENAASMYSTANKYALMDLKDQCLKFLMYNITMDNMGDAIELVSLHEVPALDKNVIAFIEENPEELLESNKWKEFSKANPSQANKYLHCALIAANKKLKSKK